MKWGLIWGIIFIAVLMSCFEWPRLNPNQKKEKVAFVILTLMGTVLCVLLVFFPDLPGPTEVLDKVYSPIGRFMEE